jgi:ABC-type antimicrobial peptide transport system permease subunit
VFDPGDPQSAIIDQQLAVREHLHPGSTLRLFVIPSDRQGNAVPSRAQRLSFRVSAIAVFDTQIVPASKVNAGPMVLLSPPFSQTQLARSASYGTQFGVRLRPGASTQATVRAATILARRLGIAGGVSVTTLADEISATERAIRPQAAALAIFAGLAGLVALAVVGQLLSRQLRLDSAEFPLLRALGMTRRGLLALSMARLAAVTAGAGLIAGGVAIAASPLMPIGPARLAEPDPGVDVNLAILGLGGAAMILLPLLLLLPAAWQVATWAGGPQGVAEPAAPARPSRLSALLARSGPLTGSLGTRMALAPGRGRTAVPVRTALVGTMVAVASVIAALVFGSSLVHLVSTPRLYGQNWQQQLDLEFGAVRKPLVTKVVAGQLGMAGYAIGNYGQVTVDGRILPAIGVEPMRGQDFVTVLRGRPPAGPHEIALGAQTLRSLHRRVGQQIQVVINGQRRNMRITGTAVLASFSRGSFAATDLGSGAVLTPPVVSQPNLASGCPARFVCYSFALLRYRPGTDLPAAAARLTHAAHKNGCPPGSCVVVSDQRPDDIRNYTGVRNTPLILGVVLALLAVGTLAHVLLTSVRRRRRDLAMLKTLGLVRRQVLGVVEWQAAAFGAVALLIGVPVGLLAGRWAWALFADAAGVSSAATVPVPLVLATIPATLALALLIAAWPGRTAARIRPAAALRAE